VPAPRSRDRFFVGGPDRRVPRPPPVGSAVRTFQFQRPQENEGPHSGPYMRCSISCSQPGSIRVVSPPTPGVRGLKVRNPFFDKHFQAGGPVAGSWRPATATPLAGPERGFQWRARHHFGGGPPSPAIAAGGADPLDHTRIYAGSCRGSMSMNYYTIMGHYVNDHSTPPARRRRPGHSKPSPSDVLIAPGRGWRAGDLMTRWMKRAG